MQKDRGAPWVLGSSEITTVGTQLPGLPPIISGQMATGTSGQPPRAPPVKPSEDFLKYFSLGLNLVGMTKIILPVADPVFMVVQLTPEMEKALLQQVMGLTPEQINLLPPEQRNQVLQLREMLK